MFYSDQFKELRSLGPSGGRRCWDVHSRPTGPDFDFHDSTLPRLGRLAGTNARLLCKRPQNSSSPTTNCGKLKRVVHFCAIPKAAQGGKNRPPLGKLTLQFLAPSCDKFQDQLSRAAPFHLRQAGRRFTRTHSSCSSFLIPRPLQMSLS